MHAARPFCSRRLRLLGLLLAAVGCSAGLPSPFRAQSPEPVASGQLVLHGRFEGDQYERLLDDLRAEREDILSTLELAGSDRPIHVYLFDTPAAFQAYVGRQYPSLPDRRAYFLEHHGQLTVFAHVGEHVAEDLRHEVAHGYMHSVVANIPLWLDEGLAEYFEVTRSRAGLNEPHVKELIHRLMEGRWRPNLPRLEQFDAVADMTQLEYAESWAWAHYLLASTPANRSLLLAYLREVDEDPAATPLSARMGPSNLAAHDRALVKHLFKYVEQP